MLVGFWRVDRIISSLIAFLLLSCISLSAFAEHIAEYTVFDVRKSLPLNDNDKVYKDYYVNMGSDSGVRVGAELSVYRKVPVIDIYRNKAQGDLVIPVAKIKVIQVQKTMSVARLEHIASMSEIPVVDFEAVMMGDRVEIAAAEGKASGGVTDGDDEDDGPTVEGSGGGGSVNADPQKGIAPQAAPQKAPEKKPVTTGSATQSSEAPHKKVAKVLPKKKGPKKQVSAKTVEGNIPLNTTL
jgi:hypothetical protein